MESREVTAGPVRELEEPRNLAFSNTSTSTVGRCAGEIGPVMVEVDSGPVT